MRALVFDDARFLYTDSLSFLHHPTFPRGLGRGAFFAMVYRWLACRLFVKFPVIASVSMMPRFQLISTKPNVVSRLPNNARRSSTNAERQDILNTVRHRCAFRRIRGSSWLSMTSEPSALYIDSP